MRSANKKVRSGSFIQKTSLRSSRKKKCISFMRSTQTTSLLFQNMEVPSSAIGNDISVFLAKSPIFASIDVCWKV
ncbi:MAG: hypothetical protein A2748_01955 [Candidatus Wildermuthbacteria bacterium RIFCSPHIGHO2_01_FULL_45_20]|uniref:Uncharacterized protein n=1 Tax=Candidatus Wildermuthbacteria bacterium RIFCSPHIGHO2_02_FULL_45_25 TaxID=1802450 RepID=A0A1G2R397_9BACT|nr:MAG: hypothetical protein A2748_01955 [Candidatus Wildermuthbacteria bacterium RIFCSPHIGHO2_01_FULL_45_20]OHA67177.1 MAG: hypothetical protein A3C04_02600 [Candidatus Wildermuthbacteria bacterium RIFCSPHIGHO2_02_FULL_45_25]